MKTIFDLTVQVCRTMAAKRRNIYSLWGLCANYIITLFSLPAYRYMVDTKHSPNVGLVLAHWLALLRP